MKNWFNFNRNRTNNDSGVINNVPEPSLSKEHSPLEENVCKTDHDPIDPIDHMNSENTPWLSFEDQTLQCKCISVTDGDTVVLVIPLDRKYYKVKCRLSNIDTAEMRTKDISEKKVAIMARQYLESLILNKKVKTICGKWDKFGRLLVTFFIPEMEMSVNDMMIYQNYGYYYDGKTHKRKFNSWFVDKNIK